jgi:hypothetical protein|tara:strand:- start:109 stop:351 length:243 start_codon:yes stop_codon:yes gene_type:complete
VSRLGSIAVVEVHVQHGYSFSTVGQETLSRNGCVIQKAITTELVDRGVMAGRSAQAEGHRFATSHQALGGLRDGGCWHRI